MTTQRWILAFCLSLASVFGTVELFKTKEIQTYTCRTFGSGIVQPFKGKSYYVRSDCPFKLTSFNVNRGEYSVTIRRGHNGLLVQVEIIINKVTTLLRNGHILVQNKSVSLPYDHTYQHIFKYGIYTRLRSSLLPFTVTWHNVHGGINSLWVTLESELCTDMCGLCGKQNVAGHRDELIRDSKLHDHRCKIRDPVLRKNHICRRFFLKTKNCLQDNNSHYHRLCKENICGLSIKVGHNLCVHAQNNCCQEKTSETKMLSAICYHPITNRREEKTLTYKHIASCECRLCNTQH
uniref:Spiggin B alternatively spliced variant 2 n=1 Tax=Gasterosteus aculeatus TaxID=69293 RepID=A0A0H5BMI1_GASAC|nr:spiggin B alternatively spliced variant 2 [Gasterosteus aculeatus]